MYIYVYHIYVTYAYIYIHMHIYVCVYVYMSVSVYDMHIHSPSFTPTNPAFGIPFQAPVGRLSHPGAHVGAAVATRCGVCRTSRVMLEGNPSRIAMPVMFSRIPSMSKCIGNFSLLFQLMKLMNLCRLWIICSWIWEIWHWWLSKDLPQVPWGLPGAPWLKPIEAVTPGYTGHGVRSAKALWKQHIFCAPCDASGSLATRNLRIARNGMFWSNFIMPIYDHICPSWAGLPKCARFWLREWFRFQEPLGSENGFHTAFVVCLMAGDCGKRCWCHRHFQTGWCLSLRTRVVSASCYWFWIQSVSIREWLTITYPQEWRGECWTSPVFVVQDG